MNRREALIGVAAVAGAAVLPAPVAALTPEMFGAKAVPILWCDGVHDDTLGLQALFDGDPVDIRVTGVSRAYVNGAPVISMGNVEVTILGHVELRKGQTLRITDPVLIGTAEHYYWL